jgi:outer membrane protein insertion porin family
MRTAAALPFISRTVWILWGVIFTALGILHARADVPVEFSGNKSFPAATLREQIASELREISAQGLTPARGDDAAYYIGSYYRKAGYSQVTVDYEIHGATLQLKINEGPLTLIDKLQFIGNAHLPESQLYQYMIGATPESLAKNPAEFPYTTAAIQAGVDRVRGLYLSEGYLNVAITEPGIQLSKDDTRAEVTVRIVEGTRYVFTFDSIQFDGALDFNRDELVKALGLALTQEQEIPTVSRMHSQVKLANPNMLDRSFSPGIVNTMQGNLQSFYKAHGYYQAEIASTADPARAVNGRVPITFTVQPHGLFRFGGVNVKTQTERPRLNPDFLPKRFAHLRGEVYDPAKLDETFREMLRSGLFENLRVTPTPIDGNTIRLDLTESEAKSKELGFMLGYGSYEGAMVGFQAADHDLFGNGRPLTFNLGYSQRGVLGELLYVDPWFLDSQYGMRSRLYSQIRNEEGYSHDDIGLREDFTRKVLPHLELGTFVEGVHTSVSNALTGTTIPQDLLGPMEYTRISFGLTQTTDFRNDPINVERGFIFTSSFDFGLINGEPGFLRASGRFSYYLPIGKGLLALGARGGYIGALDGELPIDVRFFNGGGVTVRSFAERGLGPTDGHGNPLGGNLFSVFNVEYDFLITGGLEGATFVDAGSLHNNEIVGSGSSSQGGMRYAVGLGLRYKLPIGPLRIDYGVNPDRRSGEAFGAFNFSFGFAF